MRRINLISYTPLNAGGGVPRWNRDFVAGFPGARHFSWEDVIKLNPNLAYHTASEHDKALVLSQFLLWGKVVSRDDIFICDGFWGDGFTGCPNVVSVAHGIWSHLTKEDVDQGKTPDFPENHNDQVNFRRKHLDEGKPIIAVSDFISRQMKLQWGFESSVINNGIDLSKFDPQTKARDLDLYFDGRLIIHGVTNANKGFDHIEALKLALPDDQVLLLDDAARLLGVPKYQALAMADLVVQPSAYEGNSYFVLETLACGTPIVAYNVGLLNSISEICAMNGIECSIGCVIDRKLRSTHETVKVAKWILESVCRDQESYNPRQVAELFSVQKFHDQWRSFLESRFP